MNGKPPIDLEVEAMFYKYNHCHIKVKIKIRVFKIIFVQIGQSEIGINNS